MMLFCQLLLVWKEKYAFLNVASCEEWDIYFQQIGIRRNKYEWIDIDKVQINKIVGL